MTSMACVGERPPARPPAAASASSQRLLTPNLCFRRGRVRGRRGRGRAVRERSLRQHGRLVSLRLPARIRHDRAQPLRGRVGPVRPGPDWLPALAVFLLRWCVSGAVSQVGGGASGGFNHNNPALLSVFFFHRLDPT